MKARKTSVENCSMAAIRYAKVLHELAVPEEIIEEASEICEGSPELLKVLGSPLVEREKKRAVIDRIFPKQIRSFLKVAEDNGKILMIDEIFQAYEEQKDRMNGIITAKLRYAVSPTEEQKDGMARWICKTYSADSVRWEMEEDPGLIGGFILLVGGREYDYSTLGRLSRLKRRLTWR